MHRWSASTPPCTHCAISFVISFVSITVDVISRVVMINIQDFWFTNATRERRLLPDVCLNSNGNWIWPKNNTPARERLQCDPRRRRRPRALGLAPVLAPSDRFVPSDRIRRPDGHLGRLRRRYLRFKFENPIEPNRRFSKKMSKGLSINVPTRTPLADKGTNGDDARCKKGL